MASAKRRPLTKNEAWLCVIGSGLLEIVWASGFKYEEVPSIAVIVALICSFDLIIRAAKVLPVGLVYAVFAGIGTVGTVVVDMIFSGGSISFVKIALVLFLLLCIVGLKLTGEKGAK